MKVKYIPNEFAIKFFNLKFKSFKGSGITSTLEQAIGKENYDKHAVAQDLFCGGKKKAEIEFFFGNTNRKDPLDIYRDDFKSIGIIKKVLF